jgi:EAL domain-containing protein (putative c-di-GMP-specific phosphodiesterase class I)/GGDEF domain-containing protein
MSIQQVITENLLSPHFQPIVAVNEGRVVGYEALIRGPKNLHLREPVALFAAAEKAGLLRELERACWTAIMLEVSRNLDRIPRWSRIFLNVLPEDVRDPAFFAHVVSELEKTRIDPARIVIEITETTRIDNYADFTASLRRFRDLGLGVAVDDAGAGHSGLQMITEINPDFLKIDQGLVRGIDSSIAKRAGVEALLLLARSLGMTVIAEGIENEDELHALHRLGVTLGQGFLLAQPAMEMASGIKSLPCQLQRTPWSELSMEVHGTSGRIGDIAAPAPTTSPTVHVGKVMQLFEARRTSESVVVVEKGEPIGLVMRTKLAHAMSRPFAAERVELLPISHLASQSPLVVDCESQLDTASRMATARTEEECYDDIIVARDGKLVGTVSVKRLLDAVTADRLASAKHANPLSGLPGHPVVEEWVRERARRKEDAALVHVDIDSLRHFNRLYGFHQGDRAIRIAADLIASEVAAASGGSGQVGHVGEDDFLAVVDPACADELSGTLPRLFRERAGQLYHPEDRARGYLSGAASLGDARRVPLMSLTVAFVNITGGAHVHYAELLDLLRDARVIARERSRSARDAEMRAQFSPLSAQRSAAKSETMVISNAS